MAVQLAFHHTPGTFTDRWIEICRERGTNFRIVNCFASDIVKELRTADALLWHPAHYRPEDMLLARQLIQSLEAGGLLVYPSTATFWHFDDKLAQKYLLEAMGAPLVPTYAFFTPQDADAWIERTTFPKVFKLRRGAGSRNVRLVRDAATAKKLVRRAFGAGFKPVAGYFSDARTRLNRHRKAGDLLQVLRRIPAGLRHGWHANRRMPRERGYVLFQEFVPGNTYDTRITVIGNRAFGFTRNVRRDDFRASGSGDIVYDLERIDPRCVEAAFATAALLQPQSIAFDFVTSASAGPQMVEISYGFAARPVFDCAGHWDREMNWHEGHCWPQDAILDDLLEVLNGRASAGAHPGRHEAGVPAGLPGPLPQPDGSSN